MKIGALSDGHGFEVEFSEKINKSNLDIFIYAGDFSSFGDELEAKYFLSWIKNLNVKHKILVPGNHDFCASMPEFKEECLKNNIKLLINTGCMLEGLKLFGIPNTTLSMWSFYKTEESMRDFIETIDTDIDILITHAPPNKNSVANVPGTNIMVGYYAYNKYLANNKCINIHGHLHEASGNIAMYENGSIAINVAKKFTIIEI